LCLALEDIDLSKTLQGLNIQIYTEPPKEKVSHDPDYRSETFMKTFFKPIEAEEVTLKIGKGGLILFECKSGWCFTPGIE